MFGLVTFRSFALVRMAQFLWFGLGRLGSFCVRTSLALVPIIRQLRFGNSLSLVVSLGGRSHRVHHSHHSEPSHLAWLSLVRVLQCSGSVWVVFVRFRCFIWSGSYGSFALVRFLRLLLFGLVVFVRFVWLLRPYSFVCL